ncbi:MAG TPA: hypothetical protein VK468_05435, partial [Pyrinomonadaceae bacterium]|nr:hypothetical protein [Pyrinomonadaceae bacterium]
FLFTFAAALVLPAAAQGPPPPASVTVHRSGSPGKTNGWRSIRSLPLSEEFVSLDGRFRIALPKDIQGFGALSPKQTGTTASGQQFTWKFAEGEVVMIYLDFPDSKLTGSSADLDRITSNTKNSISKRFPKATLLYENQSVLNGIPSSNLVHDLGGNEGLVTTQLYLDKTRLYRINAAFADRAAAAILNPTFKTFRLISQAEVDAELQKKYESMKPPPLPQSPVVARLTSDAQEESLKGKVKKVVEESEDRSGAWSLQGKKLDSVTYYDQTGALTQRDSYDSQGNPFQIIVYGYIDGKRVSNSKTIRYEYDPPPMAAPLAGGVKQETARDIRYEYSFEYKYEIGKLTERQMIYNNGKKGMRYVYMHSPNQVEELIYTADGKLNQRYLSVLDAGGNKVEWTAFGLANFDIYGDRKYKYTYEFDGAGNWTKKFTSHEITEDGVKTFRPYSVDYRTITYY